MSNPKALEGITVLDLTKVLAGPYCGSILADFGAEIIKIEPPGRGDDSRSYGPHLNGGSLYYENLNRGKRGLTLNLKTEEGKQVFRRLAKQADVVIENYRPGVMERFGLGYEALRQINPRLIYGAITGFGSTGPFSQRPGYDIISQAMGGMMSVTGQEGAPPTRSGNALGDILGGMNLAIGVLVALQARNVTGEGQYVDVALVDSVAASLEQAWQRYFVSGELPTRHGNSYDAIAPYDSYAAKDGFIVIGCGNQKLFEILCRELMKKPELVEDERFLSVSRRVKNNKALKRYIEDWLKDYTVDEAIELVLAHKIPAGPIWSLKELAESEHARARNMFTEIDHPRFGPIKLNSSPIKLSRTPAEIRAGSPALGENNEEILGGLGYTQADIMRFREMGVI